MQTFSELTGEPLEQWFSQFITQELLFPNYYPSSGQIDLGALNPEFGRGHHLELDGILLIHKTCILLEYTGQNGDFRDKIKKFIRSANLFVNEATISNREKFSLVGIPENKLDDFEEVEEWKFVYFGTNSFFEDKKYDRKDFPDLPFVRDRLYIFYPSQLEYYRQLASLIGKFSKNEFLATLEFSPAALGETEESIHVDFIKAENKLVTTGTTKKADVYLIKFNVAQLLKIARVSRYEGIPYILDGGATSGNYQRFLIDSKLDEIAEKFIDDNKRKTFPNTITIALSDDCVEQLKDGVMKLTIPKKFSSIDIIDGQHRLFGYTRSQVSDEIRTDSEILASAIKFKDSTPADINKNSARVFCEINSSQATVKKDLMYLIKYDVLGDRDYPALAGKVIRECDKKHDKPLGGIFLTNSLKRRNGLNHPSLEIISFIDHDLIPLMMGTGLNGTECSEEDFERIFGIPKQSFSTNPELLYKSTQIILERFYSSLKSVFSKDWEVNAETILISSAYFAAFLRFLRFYLFNLKKSLDDVRDVLLEKKTKLDSLVGIKNSTSFPPSCASLPKVNDGVELIFDFICAL